MAQFYQLTSLEELCRLYPNLQVDSMDSIQYMVQDDKIIQYTEPQGQQVLTTLEQPSIQFGQNPSTSTQHGVYVIEAVETQSLDTCKPAAEQHQLVVERINSSNPIANQMVATQPPIILQNPDSASVDSHPQKDIGNNDGKSQYILQMESSESQSNNQESQYIIHPIQANVVQVDSISQGENLQPKVVVQPLSTAKQLASPTQLIVQQFQTTRQSQGSQVIVQQLDVKKDQNLSSYTISSRTKHSNAALPQRETSPVKNDTTTTQYSELAGRPTEKNQEAVQSEFVNSGLEVVMSDVDVKQETKQNALNSNISHGTDETRMSIINQHAQAIEMIGNQLNQVLQRSPQRVSQQQQTHFLTQIRTTNSCHSGSITNLQQPRRILLKQNESEAYPGGFFIVPKSDNQMYINHFQTGIRFQGPQAYSQVVVKQKEVENASCQGTGASVQSTETAFQSSILQQSCSIPAETVENQPRHSNFVGLNQRKSSNKQTVKHVASELAVKVPGEAESIPISKMTSGSQTQAQSAVVRSLEQHLSESNVNVRDNRDAVVQTYGAVNTNLVQQQQDPVNVKIGRGIRTGLSSTFQRGAHPYPSAGRGVQLQANNARFPLLETVFIGKKVKDPKSVSGTSGWLCTGQEVRHQVAQKPIIYQFTNVSCSNEINNGPSVITNCSNISNNVSAVAVTTSSTVTSTSNNSNANTVGCTNVTNNTTEEKTSNRYPPEGVDETRMLVLFPNGEGKLLRLPHSQHCQQVRFSVGNQISIVAASDLPAESKSAGQVLIKSVTSEDQEFHSQKNLCSRNKSENYSAIASHSSGITSGTVLGNAQLKPRIVTPRIISNPSNSIRNKVHCASPRMAVPRGANPRLTSPPLQHHTQNILSQSNVPVNKPPQGQPVNETMLPPKDMPKYIPGFMAICPFCGISSLDFNKCIRCRRKLPENVKSQSIFNAKKKKSEKTTCSNEESSGIAKKCSEEKSLDQINEGIRDKPLSPGNEKKKLKQSPKKKRITDEPAEILILSSDEEDNCPNKQDSARDLVALSKEPVYNVVQMTDEEISAAMKGNNLVDDLMENIQPGSYTTLHCKTIRIGSYRIQPKERVFVSSKGVRMVIPSLRSESVTVVIPSSEIVKILIHFGKQLPMVFIYATPSISCRIRLLLGMENRSGAYYDPVSIEDETHKRITFLLEKVTEDNKLVLHNMFGQSKLLDEVTEKEANEILIRSLPPEEQGPVILRHPESVRKIMIYPPPPEKGGIALNNQDYACLGEDQFLNDVIIDFYLKYLLLKVLSPEDRERTHVFSTFFYKRLTTKPKTMRKNDPENDPKLSPAEKRHLRVKGWTKQVNLFEKDFIIVPINEHSHWFLAIICFPGLSGPVKFSDNSPVELEELKPKKSAHTVQIGNTTITHIIKSERNSASLDADPGSDRDEAEGDQDDLHPSSDDEESEQTEEESTTSNPTTVDIPLLSSASHPHQNLSKETKELKGKCGKRKAFKDPIKQPCILIFDSLAGASRVRVVATLRDYLKIEYKKKMGQDRDFSKDTIKGAVPKVPQQNNFTDCGLYVLQYVESFFQDPLHDFKLPLKYLQDWFPEEVVSCKRQELACLIRSLMEEQGIKVDEMGLPTLTFANGANTGEEQDRIDEEEEEEEDDEDEEDEEEEDEEEEEGEEDEDELEKNSTAVAELDNDEEEDMDLGEEEEEEEEDGGGGDDDDDDENHEIGVDEEDEVEVEDEEVYEEELDFDEMNNSHLHLNSVGKGEFDSEACHHSETKSALPAAYETYGCEEDSMSREVKREAGNSNIRHQNNLTTDDDVENPGTVAGRKSQVPEQRKNVPLTELQDFESQISCTTIERNTEIFGSESEMVVSDREEETFVDNSAETLIAFKNKTVGLREKLAKEKDATEVASMINKLVNEKSIVVRRKEDGANAKKQTCCYKKVKMNCDKSEDGIRDEGRCDFPPNVNRLSVKRSFEALKSVRIPKKTERAAFLNKRQKVDET